jgi:hypothetical protein
MVSTEPKLTKPYCITNQLMKAGLDKQKADIICEEANSHMSAAKIKSLPLTDIIRLYGAGAAAQLDLKRAAGMGDTIQHPDPKVQSCIDKLKMSNPNMKDIDLIRICDSNYESETQETLKKGREPTSTTSAAEDLNRTYKSMGFNSPPSTEKGLTYVPDKKYDLSHYQTVNECIDKMAEIGIDGKDICQSYFNNDSSDAGKYTAKQKNAKVALDGILYGQKNNPKLMNASKRINEETKSHYNKVVKNANVPPNEIDVPSFIIFHGDKNLEENYKRQIKSASTTQIKSAAQEREDTIYMYETLRNMTHADEFKRNPEIEKMIQEKGNQLRQAAVLIDISISI